MRKQNRKSSFLLSMVMIFALAGCTASTNQEHSPTPNNKGLMETPEAQFTLKFFDKNFDQAFNTPIAQEIIKQTGVAVEMVPIAGSVEDQLNLMLVNQDFPDVVLIDRSNDLIQKYIASDALIPLNELIDQHAPNIKAMYGDVLGNTRHDDGQNYYLSNWYGIDYDPVFGVQIRKDLLIELGEVEHANDPSKPFTTDEFYHLLQRFKTIYPSINDQPSIGMTLMWGNIGSVIGTFKGMWGIKTFYEAEDGTLMQDIRDPRYLDMLQYMNKLYREGLLDQEFVVNKIETWSEKVASGHVFASSGTHWDLDGANSILRGDHGQERLDRQLYAYKVVAPGVDPSATTYSPRSALGWDAIGITRSNPDPVRTIKFFDFLASEAGQYLLLWGIEGEHWEMVDGVHTPINGIIERFQSNREQTINETGIRRYTWFINNGTGSDGTPYDMAIKYKREATHLHANQALADSIWDNSLYDGLFPQEGTSQAVINQKIEDIKRVSLAKIIMASSKQQVEEMYLEMIEELEKNGLEELEKTINQKFAERLTWWQ